MTRIKLRFFLLLFLPLLAFANPAPDNSVLSRYFVVPSSDATMRQIAARFEVQLRKDNGYVVIVPAPQANELMTLAPGAQLIEADMTASLRAKVGHDRKGWHNFDSVQSELDQLAQTKANLVSVEQYGSTKEGRPLRALHIHSNVNNRADKPEIVITGATHGNELITTEVVFGLMNALINGYGNNPRLTKMVDDHELYFIPVVNPDGYVRMQRYCNGIDPNRDFPYPEDPNHTPNPTVQASMDFFAKHNIKGSIDYHSAAGMVFFPWAYTYDHIDSADYQDLDELTTKMAATNGYQHGQIAQTIYIAPGSSADYYYWKFHTRALGIEISQDGSSSLIPSMLKENTESTWTFIESF